MKKTALLTWFHYRNYGTALQVIALHNTIQSFGYDVDVVDYIPEKRKKRTDTNFSRVLSLLKRWTKKVSKYVRPKKKKPIHVVDVVRETRYDTFVHNRLSFTNPVISLEDFAGLNAQYDAFICGSDQIWAPSLFNPHYFLDFVRDDQKKIAYAPSVGETVIDNERVKESMQRLISSFAFLSVREQQAADLIADLCTQHAEVVLDPTLLLSYAQWRAIIPSAGSSEKYLLCYFLGENENAWHHAAVIAKIRNLPLRIIPIFAKDVARGECVFGTGPEEFFNLIDNADCVCTDSFHGTIFSLTCKKPMYVFERFRHNDKRSQNSRIYHLLQMTNLAHRLIQFDEPIKNHYELPFDSSTALQLLDAKRESSLNFLKRSLAYA